MFRHYNNLNCLITRLILKISPSVVLAICKFSVSNLFLSSPSILSLRQKMAAACHYCRFKSIKNSLRSGSIAETVELQLKPKKKVYSQQVLSELFPLSYDHNSLYNSSFALQSASPTAST